MAVHDTRFRYESYFRYEWSYTLSYKRHIITELSIRISVLRLLHVGNVVQNKRSALPLAWQEWCSCKGREWRICLCGVVLSSELQIWKFHVVVWQTTSKNCTNKCAASGARWFSLIQPIKSLLCGVVVADFVFSRLRAGWDNLLKLST